jgi:glucose-6-phosphate isomerase
VQLDIYFVKDMSSESKIEDAWKALHQHYESIIKNTHLADLMQDQQRYQCLTAEYDKVFLDFSRQRLVPKTMDLLFDLAQATEVQSKIAAMAAGQKINTTENRAVMHMALRANATDVYKVDGTFQPL